MRNRRILMWCFAAVLLWSVSGRLFACSEGRPMPPPPNPSGQYKVQWNKGDAVVYGTIIKVKRNIDRTWVDQKLIDFGILNASSPGGMTPRHRVELASVHQFIGVGYEHMNAMLDLAGCGIPIPKIGEQAIFFISTENSNRYIVPLYQSDGDLFNTWIRVLNSSLSGTHPLPTAPTVSRAQ